RSRYASNIPASAPRDLHTPYLGTLLEVFEAEGLCPVHRLERVVHAGGFVVHGQIQRFAWIEGVIRPHDHLESMLRFDWSDIQCVLTCVFHPTPLVVFDVDGRATSVSSPCLLPQPHPPAR